MRKLDRDSAKQLLQKLAQIPEDAKPLWGTMNRAQLYGHLVLVMRHMLGDGPGLPFKGNWLTRNVFRHLIVYNVVEIPHNVRLPRPNGVPKGAAIEPPTATLADVEAAMSAYLDGLDAGTVRPALHPFFGVLRNDEWRRFHIAHFKHHCKQFGVW